MHPLTLQYLDDLPAPFRIGRYLREKQPRGTPVQLTATADIPQVGSPREAADATPSHLVAGRSRQIEPGRRGDR
ncbi:hypothetical protein [Paeniglutamicibacter sp.]|uniref:hypothetical protein n=1 Tax=Paeniglutamicibacter sp. TaxID=1934391 RepID=UPI0039892F31